MAIALTNLTPANGTAGNTTDHAANSAWTTASFTAAANTWVILSFTLSGTGISASTIPLSSSTTSGSLGTLTQISSVAPTTTYRHIVAAAWAGASGFTGTISMTANSITTGCAWSVVQAAGLDPTTPYITSNVQTVSSGTAVSSRTLTMNAAASVQNRTFASWQTSNNTAGTITAPSGYAELCESSYSTPANKIETIWSTSAFGTSPSVTEDSTYTISGIAFELNSAPLSDSDAGASSEAATATVLSYPAALYEETFDEGVNGSTLSTSFGGPATSYTLGSGGTAAYSATANFAGLSAFFNCSSQGDFKYVSLPVSGTSPYYVRAYFMLPGGFGGGGPLWSIARAPGVSQISVNSNTGQLNFVGTNSTSVVADGNWWRIEWDLDPTGGSRKVRLYTGARLNSVVPTESISGTDTAGLTFTLNELQFGAFATSGVIPSIYWDNIAVSTAGPVGPYVPSTNIGPATDTASATEAATVVVTTNASDTGSSAESASAVNLVTPISDADTGAGADASALTATTSATDTASAADAANLARASDVTVSDTIGLGDTASPAAGHATNVSDGIGLGDTSVTSAGFTLTVSDGMPVIEDVAVGGSQSVSDGVGLTDSVSITTDYARTTTDAAGLNDSAVFGAAPSRSTSDDAGLSDSVSFGFSGGIIITDSTGLSDRVVVPGIFADQIGISDSSTQSASYVRSITDSAGLTEATFLAGTYRRGVDDAGLADTLFFDIVRAPADSAGISDGFSWEGTRTFFDTAGLGDSSSPSAAYSGPTPADAMPVSDTTTTAARYNRAHDETTLGADSTALEVSIVIVDRATVLEDVTQAGSYALTVTDATGTSDSTVRAAGVSRTLQDTLTLSEGGLGVGYGLALVDLLQVIDTADILPTPGGSDTVTAVDTATVVKRNLGIHLVRLTVTDLEDAQVMRVGTYRS